MTHPGLEHVQQAIRAAATTAGRDPEGITLIAVGKTFGAPDILPVIAAGQKVFGENRIQESKAKWPTLKAYHPDLKLHLIGPLQRRLGKIGTCLFRRVLFLGSR